MMTFERIDPYLRGIHGWIAQRVDDDRLHTLRAEDIALTFELDEDLTTNKRGPISNGRFLRFASRVHILLTIALFALIAVWKFKNEESFMRSDSLLILNLVVGSVQAMIYVVTGTSFCKYAFLALKKLKTMERTLNPRRRLVCIMAALDIAAGVVSITGFLASNAIALSHGGCGYFLGPTKVFTALRIIALGAILANQMCLSIVALPVEMIFSIVDTLRLGWVVRVFDTQDRLRNVVHGVDLPPLAFVVIFCLYFVPMVGLVVPFVLSMTGPLGGHWCTSIYDTRCYPGATEGVDCHQWEYPCDQVGTASRGLGIATSAYSILVMIIYFVTIIGANLYLKHLPYLKYRVSHIEVGFALSTRMYTSVMFVLSTSVLWLADNGDCNPHVVLLVGFLPTELVVGFLVATTMLVRTPYFINGEEFASLQWNKTFVWSTQHINAHLATRPALSKKSALCFERALQAFYFSYVAYDLEENPSSPFTIHAAMRLHGLKNYKLVWKRRLDAKAIISWNAQSKEIAVAFRGTSSMSNACTDVKFLRSAHRPMRGSYVGRTMPLVHAGFSEFWYESALNTDVLAVIDQIISDKSEVHGDAGKPWEIFCYGHSLGGATAKLAALDIHRHLENERSTETRFNVSCYTIGCPYVGNQAFVNDFESTISCAWDLFHPNDAVSITGKWYYLYARCSQVCLISRFGDLVPNPSKLERTSLHPFGLRRVKEHLLTTYGNSFLSIMEKWQIMDEHVHSPERGDSFTTLCRTNPAVKDAMLLLKSIYPAQDPSMGLSKYHGTVNRD